MSALRFQLSCPSPCDWAWYWTEETVQIELKYYVNNNMKQKLQNKFLYRFSGFNEEAVRIVVFWLLTHLRLGVIPMFRRNNLHTSSELKELGLGCQWRSWLRHCATSRKVAVSIPDCASEFFVDIMPRVAFWPWGRLIPQQRWVQECSLGQEGGWKRPVRGAGKLSTFICRLSSNSGSLKLLESSGPVQACTGIALPLLVGEVITTGFSNQRSAEHR